MVYTNEEAVIMEEVSNLLKWLWADTTKLEWLLWLTVLPNITEEQKEAIDEQIL